MIKIIFIIALILLARWLFKKFISPILGTIMKILIPIVIVFVIVIGLTIIGGAASGMVELPGEDGSAPLVEQYDFINEGNQKTIKFIDKTDTRMPCPENAGIGVKIVRGVDKVIRIAQNRTKE